MGAGWLKRVLRVGMAAALCAPVFPAQATEPVTLKVVGGLAGIRQFTGFEQPFWETEIGAISGGRIKATIHPFDRSGIRGQDMLQLMKIGVVPFGNALLSVAASDTPMLQGVDLPGVNPDFATLRQTISTYRPKLKAALHDLYNIELLGIYSYPAQVLFCARPFDGLNAIGGFKIRTSSIAQSDLVTAMGARPVIMPFSEIVDAIRRKSVDCAITGILSGHEIGLAGVTTHVHAQAINWGVSIFGANRTAWENLSPDARETVMAAVQTLEERILRAAEADTLHGFACSRGEADCTVGTARRQTVVMQESGSDSANMQIVRSIVLPQWFDRCGDTCESIVAEGALPLSKQIPAFAAPSTFVTGGASD